MLINQASPPLARESLWDLTSALRCRLPLPIRWACLFFAIGILFIFFDSSYRMSFIQRAQIVTIGDSEIYADPNWSTLPLASKLGTMAAWTLLFGSSVLAFIGGSARFIPKTYRLYYLGMWFVSGYLLLGMTTDPVEILSTSRGLFGKMAPGTLLGIGVFFLAADPEAWRYIRKYLLLLAWIACGIWTISALQMTHPSRAEAYRWIYEPTLLLEVTALLPLGLSADRRFLSRALRYAPMALLLLAALLMQTRLLVVIVGLLALGYGFLRWRGGALREERTRGRLLFTINVFLPVALLGIVLAWPLTQQTIVGGSTQGLWKRRSEETRIRQIKPFFEKATWDKMLVGTGYPNPGEYNAEGANGIDSGYLNTMYVTGLPMMGLYVLMLVLPALGCLKLRLSAEDAAVVATALAYCVRMTSSTIPSFSEQFLVACVLLGRCAYILHASRLAARQGALEPSDGARETAA